MIKKTSSRILITCFLSVFGLFVFASQNIIAQTKNDRELIWSAKLSIDDPRYVEITINAAGISDNNLYISSNIRCTVAIYGKKGKLGDKIFSFSSTDLNYGKDNKKFGLHGFAGAKSVKAIKADFKTVSSIIVLSLNVPATEVSKKEAVNRFITELEKMPEASGYIIFYGSNEYIEESQAEFRKLFVAKKFDVSRLTFVSAKDEKDYIKLYIVPAGALSPVP